MYIEPLISLPPAMVPVFSGLEDRSEWFAACDPPGGKLGSGGGVAHLLATAAAKDGRPFDQWLGDRKKLALMAGGQSRRLPAYAAEGKILMPMPALRWGSGQRIDQTLLDLQVPDYERVLAHAPENFRLLVASGDVMLRFGSALPKFPEVDILGLGMWVDAETASHFGVFFSPRADASRLAFFLQKPSPAEIRAHAAEHLFLVDTGMWLLSARAVDALLRKCGWMGTEFRDGTPYEYELYAGLGPCLGDMPQERDPALEGLTAAVVALPEAKFHHFGTSRQMIESASALQNEKLEQSSFSRGGVRAHPDVYVLNSDFAFTSRSAGSRHIWVENCGLPPDLPLATENVLTGIPAGDWTFRIEPGVCIDMVPVGESQWCTRMYGFDDAFKGPVGDSATTLLGRPAVEWFAKRGLDMAEPTTDIQKAPLFPLLDAPPDSAFLGWLFAAEPRDNAVHAPRWLASGRLSAQQIGERANLSRVLSQRRQFVVNAAPRIFANRGVNIFYRLDLDDAAALYAESDAVLPARAGAPLSAMDEVHESMFRAAVLRRRGDAAAASEEGRAFAVLREAITASAAARPAAPTRMLMDDQIAWGRSPVRLDLAGGWSDTPPYCFKAGGAVLNLAVNLNGQPPVQVYVRQTAEARIVLRSIDLGAQTVVTSLDDLREYDRVGGEFSLAKAAVALAGFDPRFSAHTGTRTLDDILAAFGGGIEISMLAATPKGSGLGTSSILGATLLGTLSEACGLAWDARELFQRTLALEQLLTTGGGWQDQAGGIFRGVKLVETSAGLTQQPQIRWLPSHMFGPAAANQTVLLYYTGMKRVAKGILQEVVRGMFLNRGAQLRVLDRIKEQAYLAFEAVQRDDWDALCEVVAGSWELNKELDSGTNPLEVDRIFSQVGDYLAGAKLLGAGGGGYMVMFAKDAAAAVRIRESLSANPPNALARFVQMELSETGLQVTRS